MASQKFNPQNLVVGVIKFICGVAIALFVICLAGAATARYFLTQLATLPARPVYENDTGAAKANNNQTPGSAPPTANGDAQPAANEAPKPSPQTTDANVLFKATVTYGGGLLIRTGAGADYETIDGIDYDETIDVLEESGKWYKIRTSNGVEGWIKGRDNTQRL